MTYNHSLQLPLTPAQKTKLDMMMDLIPLLYAYLRTLFSSRSYASDTSLTSSVVVYCDRFPYLGHFIHYMCETRARKVSFCVDTRVTPEKILYILSDI